MAGVEQLDSFAAVGATLAAAGEWVKLEFSANFSSMDLIAPCPGFNVAISKFKVTFALNDFDIFLKTSFDF